MALTARDTIFLDRLGRTLGKAAARKVRPRVREASRTLARAMTVQRLTTHTTQVFIPHYWAVMVHDGRNPFSRPFAMVWFRDIRNDPRLLGGQTPQRMSQLRRLTKDQFSFWLRENRKADPSGMNPRARPMIVSKVIHKRTIANRFFDNSDGMRGFAAEASDIASQMFSNHVAEVVPGVRKVIVDVAVARLG